MDNSNLPCAGYNMTKTRTGNSMSPRNDCDALNPSSHNLEPTLSLKV